MLFYFVFYYILISAHYIFKNDIINILVPHTNAIKYKVKYYLGIEGLNSQKYANQTVKKIKREREKKNKERERDRKMKKQNQII